MTTVKWAVNSNGTFSFNTPANWQYGAVPGIADLALFAPAEALIYFVGGNATVGGIEVDNGFTDITGSLTLSGALATDVTVTAGTLRIDGSVQGPGAIQVSGSGTLQVNGTLSGSSATVNSSAQLFVTYGSSLNLSGSLNLNDGIFEALTTNSLVPTIFTLGTPIVLTGLAFIEAEGGVTLNITGPISGSGSLNTYLGNVQLSGSNTYTGGTTINSGQLLLGANELPTTGTLTMSNSGSLVSTASQAINNTRNMTGNVAFSAATGTTLTLSAGANAWTLTEVLGATVQFGIGGNTGTVAWGHNAGCTINNVGFEGVEIVGGTLKAIDNGLPFLLQDVSGTTVDTGATLDLNGFGASTPQLLGGGRVTNSGAGTPTLSVSNGGIFSGVIDGGIALDLTGGALTLQGANAYNGGTTIAAGSLLTLGFGGFTGSITGNIADNGTLQANNAGATAFAGNITGNGSFLQSGSGQTTLTGTNNYSGGTSITGGTLAVLGSALPTTGMLTMFGGGLLATATQTINNTRVMTGNVSFSAAAGQTLTLSAPGGPNTWTFNEVAGTTMKFGVGGATGTVAWGIGAGLGISGGGSEPVEIVGGTLKAVDGGLATLLGNAASTTVDAGATVDTAGFTTIINNLQGAGQVTDSGAQATLLANGGNFSGKITGTVALSVFGELTLTGANTYSGGTTVNAGATLVLGTGGTTGSAASITDNGTVDIKYAVPFQLPSLTGTGKLVVEGPSVTIMNGASNFSGGTLLGGGKLVTAAGASGSGGIAFANGSTAILQILGANPLTNAVSGFANGDVIDFANVVFNQVSFTGGVLTMKENGTTVDQLTLSTPYAAPMFNLMSDGGGGTQIELSPVVPTGLALAPVSDSGIQGDNVTDVKLPTITGFGTPGDTIKLFDGTSQIGSGTVAAGGQWSIASNTALALGAHSLSATQTDGFGDVSPASAAMPLSIVQSPAVNDVNGDSKSDIILQNNDGTVGVWEMNGLNVAATGVVYNPGPAWHVLGTGDFDGNGTSDILLQNDDGTVGVWLMNGFNMVGAGIVADPGPTWHAIGTGDFNGDGKSDIVLQNNDGTVAVWEMSGLNQIQTGVVADPGPSWHVIGTGDFTGNGKSDILLQNSDGTIGVWLMNGTSMAGAAALGNPGKSWHAIGTGDINGDGKADILLQNDSGQVGFWEMNGTSISAMANAPVNPGTTTHLLGGADFNGDGLSDVFFQDTGGQVSAWQMNGLNISTTANLANPGPSWHVIP